MNRQGPQHGNDDGASEVIGIILLVSMIVLAFGIVSLVLVSQPQKTQVPEISAVIGNVTNATAGQNVVYITHSGGDSLKGGQYLIFVNHIDRTSQITGNGTMDWNVGETLVVPMGNETPMLVQIYFQGPTESDLLVEHTLQPGANITYIPTSIPTTSVTTTTTTSPTPTATIPVPPGAGFVANITSGKAPLAVSFTDQSTGNPTSWAWDFNNDGIIESNLKNPVWTYPVAGTYSVKLTVSNSYGTNSTLKINYIVVSSPISGTGNSILLNGATTGGILVGGTQFSLRTNGGGQQTNFISIDSVQTYIGPNDDLAIIVNGDQSSGKIYMTDQLTTCDIYATVLYNGIRIGSGHITGIYIQKFKSYQSTLSYRYAGKGNMQFVVDGKILVDYPDQKSHTIVLNTIDEDKNANVLNMDWQTGHTYVVCSGAYSLV
jgi:PKD repeat protein